jgi:hypothetical protein
VPATLPEECKDRRRGFLDRAPRNIDQRPIVFRAQPPRGGNFLGHRLLIDIFVVITVRLQPKQPTLTALPYSIRTDTRRTGMIASKPAQLPPHSNMLTMWVSFSL